MSLEMREKRLPEKDGVFFLIYKDGKVLLEERLLQDKAYYGYTIIPSGKMDKLKDADHLDAARREIEEECGIKPIDLIQLDTFYDVTITNHFYNTSAFLITNFEGEVRNVEGKSRQMWVDIKYAQTHLLFADMRYIILLAQLYLNGKGPLKG
jgi:8-oxo-dGTP pyrophosphatase MutT (NUDIX family)